MFCLRCSGLCLRRMPSGGLSFFLDDGSDIVGVIVEVAGAEGNEDIEVKGPHDVKHICLTDEPTVNARAQMVENDLAGDALNGLFASRIDLREYDLIEL